MLSKDEQMALLVQRVSGDMHNRLFFPQVAGVGYSYNPYVWNERIDPAAGMVRLVFGLGTRAVDRADDDYTRVAALNEPEMRPESDFDKVRRFAQRRVDVIDLDSNQLISADFDEVGAQTADDINLDMFASRDRELERRAAKTGRKDIFPWVLTFDKLLKETNFVPDMSSLLQSLETAYGASVDIEFTANFVETGGYKINLLQCRPLQVKGYGPITAPPVDIKPKNLILETHGPVIGQSRVSLIDWIIYVVPSVYGKLPMEERYAAARLVGRLMHNKQVQGKTIMLLGPGRWGSAMPALGVPVSFAEINTVSILCEIVAMNENLVPDVSLGTHFFNDLVEADILYLALFPGREGNVLNEKFLMKSRNMLEELAPDYVSQSDAVRVIKTSELADGIILKLNSNAIKQQVVCYRETESLSGV